MWDETARLDTVSPAGQMEAAEDDILPAVPELNMPPRYVKKYVRLYTRHNINEWGLTLNRGDIVSYQNFVLARMPEVWGKDASVFDPSRWFTEDGDTISYSPFSKLCGDSHERGALVKFEATDFLDCRIPLLECGAT